VPPQYSHYLHLYKNHVYTYSIQIIRLSLHLLADD